MNTLRLDPEHARALVRDLAHRAATTPNCETRVPPQTPGTSDLISAFTDASRTLNRRRTTVTDHIRALVEVHGGPGGHIDAAVEADRGLAAGLRA
ncbi:MULTISPECIES: hypothetical protein [unclassified Corynebacterium]|uniref:hypothetical protein n=1 Tax=unclassified Corynebacterium TaxID=2624378 RepID=UPI00352375DA